MSDATASEPVPVGRYDLMGRALTAKQPGLNIVRLSDGTTRKELVK